MTLLHGADVAKASVEVSAPATAFMVDAPPAAMVSFVISVVLPELVMEHVAAANEPTRNTLAWFGSPGVHDHAAPGVGWMKSRVYVAPAYIQFMSTPGLLTRNVVCSGGGSNPTSSQGFGFNKACASSAAWAALVNAKKARRDMCGPFISGIKRYFMYAACIYDFGCLV